jgi:hypothetical protein
MTSHGRTLDRALRPHPIGTQPHPAYEVIPVQRQTRGSGAQGELQFCIVTLRRRFAIEGCDNPSLADDVGRSAAAVSVRVADPITSGVNRTANGVTS